MLIPVVAGIFGMVYKNLGKSQDELEIRGRIETIQT